MSGRRVSPEVPNEKRIVSECFCSTALFFCSLSSSRMNPDLIFLLLFHIYHLYLVKYVTGCKPADSGSWSTEKGIRFPLVRFEFRWLRFYLQQILKMLNFHSLTVKPGGLNTDQTQLWPDIWCQILQLRLITSTDLFFFCSSSSATLQKFSSA